MTDLVPEWLTELIETFKSSVLRNKPNNPIQYAAEYFLDLSNKPEELNYSGNLEWLTDLLENLKISVLKNKPPNLVHNCLQYFLDLSGSMPEMTNKKLSNYSTPIMKKKVEHDRSHVWAPHQKQANRGRRQSEDDEDLPVVSSKPATQRSRLVEAIKPIVLFRRLDEEQRGNIIDSMREVTVKNKRKVIIQGDVGDDFYVIETGEFDILVDGNKIGHYSNSGSFGELALMYNTPHDVTIIAKSEGILWAIDRETFHDKVLKNAFKKRQMYQGLLQPVHLLMDLKACDRTNVADALISRTYGDGDMILEQGTPGMEMFFIKSDEVRVIRDLKYGSAPKLVNELEKGDYIGDKAEEPNNSGNLEVPAELTELLDKFKSLVLKNKPPNFVQYGLQHFLDLSGSMPEMTNKKLSNYSTPIMKEKVNPNIPQNVPKFNKCRPN